MNYFALLFFGIISISCALATENDFKRKLEDEERPTFIGQNQLKKIKSEEGPKEDFKTIEIFRKKPMAMMELAFNIFIKKGEIDGPYKKLTYSEKDRFYFNHFQSYFIETGIKINLPNDLFESYLKKFHELKPTSLPVPLKVKILCLTTWSVEDFAEIFDDPFWAKPQSTRFLDQQMVKNVSIQETLSYDSPTFSSSLSALKSKCDEFHRLDLLVEAEGPCPNVKGITKALLESGAPIYALKLSWLHDVELDDKGAMEISTMLRTVKTLGRLDLGDNNLNEDGMFNIIESLKHNKSLNYINISAYEDKMNVSSEYPLTHKCANALKDMLLFHNKTLTHIILSNNLIDEAGVKNVVEIIKGNRSLKRLCLSHNRLSCESVKNIAQALASNKTLQCLDMSYCHITHESIESLIEALKLNRALIEIKLGGNEISLKDKIALEEVCNLNPRRRVDYAPNMVNEALHHD